MIDWLPWGPVVRCKLMQSMFVPFILQKKVQQPRIKQLKRLKRLNSIVSIVFFSWLPRILSHLLIGVPYLHWVYLGCLWVAPVRHRVLDSSNPVLQRFHGQKVPTNWTSSYKVKNAKKSTKYQHHHGSEESEKVKKIVKEWAHMMLNCRLLVFLTNPPINMS